MWWYINSWEYYGFLWIGFLVTQNSGVYRPKGDFVNTPLLLYFLPIVLCSHLSLSQQVQRFLRASSEFWILQDFWEAVEAGLRLSEAAGGGGFYHSSLRAGGGVWCLTLAVHTLRGFDWKGYKYKGGSDTKSVPFVSKDNTFHNSEIYCHWTCLLNGSAFIINSWYDKGRMIY